MTDLVRVVADDVTGATDVADTLSRTGRRTLVTIGVPAPHLSLAGFAAVVVALKTRTAPVAEAVAESVRAYERLAGHTGQLVFKVCSTFDSTAQGNIGPVADALLDRLGPDAAAVVCPAMPDNRRTVYMGHLFVGDRLLQESPMADHPLTPMRDSDLVRLLDRQSWRRVGLVGYQTVKQGRAAIRAELDGLVAGGIPYAVVDAVDGDDLREIAAAGAGTALWVAGSGLPGGLPRPEVVTDGSAAAGPAVDEPAVDGPAAVVAGSASVATRRQVERFARSAPALRLVPERLLDEPGYAEALAERAAYHVRRSGQVLVYSSAPPDEVARAQSRGPAGAVAARVETALARVASVLVESAGVRRLVVAGGETAGAVLRALGVTALAVGPTIAPGVPWTRSVAPDGLCLALKSGNFGGPDFFTEALAGPPG
jgi:3-dehydrotetronate 4-kinase